MIRSTKVIVKGILFCTVSALTVSVMFERAVAQATNQPKIVLNAYPEDAFLIGHLNLASFREQADVKLLPWEAIQAFSVERLGIDLCSASAIDLAVGAPKSDEESPEFCIVAKFKEGVDVSNLNNDDWGNVKAAKSSTPVRFRDNKKSPHIRAADFDANVLVIGTADYMKNVLVVTPRLSPLSKVLNFATGDASIAFSSKTGVEQIDPLLTLAQLQPDAEVPGEIIDSLNKIANLSTDYLVDVRSIESFEVETSQGTVTHDDALKLSDELKNMRRLFLNYSRQILAMNESSLPPDLPESIKKSFITYLDRISNLLDNSEFWVVEKNRVVMSPSSFKTMFTVGFSAGLIFPAIQQARVAANRMTRSNNIRQLGLGILNYEYVEKNLPARVTKDANGKSLLSWRVFILPYIEQDDLYKQFHLDEPWDSEHNIKLIPLMPETFASPGNTIPAGHTCFLMPYGESLGHQDDAFGFAEATDGLSNTIMLAEVAPSNAAIWTKPDDLDFDNADFASIFSPSGFHILMLDCACAWVPEIPTRDLFKAAASLNGEEEFELTDLTTGTRE